MSIINSVCVYCGSSAQVNQKFKDISAELGKILARESVRLIYGGGRVGLMGIIADAAYTNNGEVIGIIPEHIEQKEIKNHELTELFVVDSMHTRKQMMAEKSDGFVALPGGMGTLDESFEILTWKYLGLHNKPFVFVNTDGFYNPLLEMIDHMVSEGFTPITHKDMYKVVENPEEVLPALRAQTGDDHLDTKHL